MSWITVLVGLLKIGIVLEGVFLMLVGVSTPNSGALVIIGFVAWTIGIWSPEE